MFNYGEVTEEQEKKYEYAKSSDAKKPVSAFFIELKDGSIISFPYSYYAPTELKNKKNGNYEINLIGGGLGLLLCFKNFEAEKRDFLAKMRKSLIDTLYEYAGQEISKDQPILDKVEVLDMKRR